MALKLVKLKNASLLIDPTDHTADSFKKIIFHKDKPKKGGEKKKDEE